MTATVTKKGKAKGVVKKTKDYSLFKNHPKNRLVSPGGLSALRAKIIFNNQLHLNAIVVTNYDASIDPDPENNEVEPTYYIINGKHRCTIAEEEDLHIYYTVDNDITEADIVDLNYSRPWSDADYLRYYIERPAYKLVEKYCKDYKLSISAARCILSQKTTVNREIFNRGDYKIADKKEARNIALCITGMVELLPPAMRHVPKMNRFVRSLIQATKQGNFDMEHFKNQTQMNVHLVFHTPTTYFARMCIEKIYCGGSTKKFKFKDK